MKGKCDSCKFDMSDYTGTLRTEECPDHLDGKISDGCEKYQPDEVTNLTLKEEEKKERQDAKERKRYQKEKEKAELKAYQARSKAKYRRKGSSFGYEKKLIALITGVALILVLIYYLPTLDLEPRQESPNDDETVNTAAENMTEMLEDLLPSFVLLVFVMVFMLMLLTIVDRVGR